MARGSGIDNPADKERLRAALLAADVPGGLIQFASDGPDLSAISKAEWWQVECKGAGAGKPPTQRNNFDRSLASVVSYFEEAAPKFTGELSPLSGARPYLGLALPATDHYVRELRRRVRAPLRRFLNLWVLLYEPTSKSIRAVAPGDSY